MFFLQRKVHGKVLIEFRTWIPKNKKGARLGSSLCLSCHGFSKYLFKLFHISNDVFDTKVVTINNLKICHFHLYISSRSRQYYVFYVITPMYQILLKTVNQFPFAVKFIKANWSPNLPPLEVENFVTISIGSLRYSVCSKKLIIQTGQQKSDNTITYS